MAAPNYRLQHRRGSAPRQIVLGLLILAVVALAGLLSSPRAVAANEREIVLTPGFNQVVYTGPESAAAQIGDQIPGLRAIYRWDAVAQQYRSYSPLLPGSGGDLESLRWGDALWLDVTSNSLWSMPIVQGPDTVTLHAGWNLVGWGGGQIVSPDLLLDPINDRITAAFLLGAAGMVQLYSPLLPAAVPVTEIAPNDVMWLNISGQGALAWDITAGSIQTVAAGPLAPLATDVQQVRDAVVYIASSTQGGGGFIVSNTQILTAAHVVGRDTTVTVRFPHLGEVRRGRVSATDTALDIAVITVDDVPVGARRLDWQSAARPGYVTPVWAWGFPWESRVVASGFNLAVTVSGGIVSAHRERNGVATLQTDAAINPGNSGGPLTTVDGRVVGMNVHVLTVDGEDAEGLNFALDIATHRGRITELLRAN